MGINSSACEPIGSEEDCKGKEKNLREVSVEWQKPLKPTPILYSSINFHKTISFLLNAFKITSVQISHFPCLKEVQFLQWYLVLKIYIKNHTLKGQKKREIFLDHSNQCTENIRLSSIFDFGLKLAEIGQILMPFS
jgi:hypothetical protein